MRQETNGKTMPQQSADPAPAPQASDVASGPAPDHAEEMARARQVLMSAANRRIEACAADLRAVLEKHRCRLSTRQEWVDGQPVGPAQVIAVPID
jgi:hypothetical protein